MEKIVIGSMYQNAGKTSVIIGIAKTLEKRIGYMKPFGDRIFYEKKRLLDLDSLTMTSVFNIEDIHIDEMTIGFDHSKLRFLYDKKSIKEKFLKNCLQLEEKKMI